jgi:hypothetical protein
MSLEAGECALLVSPHQPLVAKHIGRWDIGEPGFKPLGDGPSAMQARLVECVF